MGQWGYYAEATLQFLDVLESQGMITRVSNSKMTIITIVNYDKYQDLEDYAEQKSKRKPKHNKEKEEVKNKNNSIFLSKDSDLKFYDELFNQEIFLESISKNLNLESDHVKLFLSKFKSEMLLQEKFHKDINDMKSHFFNWTKKVVQNSKNIVKDESIERKNTESKNKYAARRGTASNSHSPDEYGGAF